MKKLGKLVIMQDTEYRALVYAESRSVELIRARDEAVAATRKWHAAGGYSHTLPKLKEELRQAQEQVSRYRPIGEIFQPSKELTALLEDVNGVSDVDAAADFEVVGNQVRLAKAKL